MFSLYCIAQILHPQSLDKERITRVKNFPLRPNL